MRNVFITETFFILIEKEFIRNKRQNAKKILYGIGKRFGYRFSMLNKFPKGNLNKIVLDSICQFFEIPYAKKIYTNILDPTNKVWEIRADNLAITNKSGLGFAVTIGGLCGIWCYLNSDYSLEASITKASKNVYSLFMAPRKILRDNNYNFIEYDRTPKVADPSLYIKNNTTITSLSRSSFDRLFKVGIIAYKPGNIFIKKSEERIIPVEISLLYELEENIDGDLIYKSAFESFYNIGLDSTRLNKNTEMFLCDLLTGFGFGVAKVIDFSDGLEISFTGYPWYTKENENTSFAYIKGATVGLLESTTGKRYIVNSVSSNLANNIFTVILNVSIR